MFHFLRRSCPPAAGRPVRLQISRFEPGQIVVSPAAAKLLEKNGVSLQSLLDRHVRGDQGDTPPEEQSGDEDSLLGEGDSFASQWRLEVGTLWILTYSHRAGRAGISTTVITMEEFTYR
jgi:hypothetical protein